MHVIAQKDGIDHSLVQLHPDDFDAAVKKHPDFIGIPWYWVAGNDGPNVWPNPDENTKIVTRE